MTKSYIVKLKSIEKYFKIDWYLTSIVGLEMVSEKAQATIFQQTEPSSKFDYNNVRCTEFGVLLRMKKVSSEQITVEQIEAPKQPLLTESESNELENLGIFFQN